MRETSHRRLHIMISCELICGKGTTIRTEMYLWLPGYGSGRRSLNANTPKEHFWMMGRFLHFYCGSIYNTVYICENSTNYNVQFNSVAQSCPTLCDPMKHSTPGHPVHHQLLEFTQTHVHRVTDANQPSHPLSSPSPPAPNPSQQQSLFQWVNSSHQVAKVLEFQL